MSFYISSCRFLLYWLISICLTSCMVGPNWVRPQHVFPTAYNAHPLPRKTASTPTIQKGGRPQTYLVDVDIPAEWWTLFRSPEIDCLIRLGLFNSPTLVAAKAKLRQAQDVLYETFGANLLPTFDAIFNGTRQRFTGSSFGATGAGGFQASTFNVFNANVTASYTLDVFGGLRRQVEAAGAQVEFQQYEVAATYLTLTTNIVTTAIATASLEEQIIATKDLIRAQAGFLQILRGQFRLGGIALNDVLTQETLLNQTRATLPPLERQLSATRHALAVLIGAFPNYPFPNLRLRQLSLPECIPVSLPSNLVRQRPDVLAAEATLHTASANIGVATANLLPNFTFNGFYGWQADTVPSLFTNSTKVWSLTGQVLQPIFHGGALFARRRQAIAAYEEACANYRQTVLQAFQNVGDALRALDTDARTLQAQRDAELAARRALDLTNDQYRLGGVNYLTILIAQQQYEQTRIARIKAEASRYIDTATLFQTLGGGWWHKNREFCRWRWCK